ncbi:hypothetical protein [Actinomadura bangladeshensis]|uniref:GNAT family N-acetyltransferase n=1 Tax=Actinomadura bangladeshensis TaxID=453573 RepID=A0A4R4P875_9ACTN|nr:hypothetical protein [Actinomadura bangladeshensis]TDC18219.1 hypothetical protein E1284_07070 [Actinomadura bangladeshensis]
MRRNQAGGHVPFVIRELPELDELAAACELVDRIWGFEDGALSILGEIMRGYAYEGNYVAGTFHGGALVGASVIWTFDPPVRRNAHFNLAKLGARAEAYLENHYGQLPDAINGARTSPTGSGSSGTSRSPMCGRRSNAAVQRR